MTSIPPTSGEDARDAADHAEKQLKKQNSLWSAIRQRVATLSQLAEENHFSDKIVEAFRSKP